MYQSVGVVRNSRIARRASGTSGTGSMNPLCVTRRPASGPMLSRLVTRWTGLPARPSNRATVVAIGLRAKRGMNSGAPIDPNVSPGTPATANRPLTRSGWVTASSNMVFTPIDQPTTGHAGMPASSSTAKASSTNSSWPTRSGSVGRAEPPTPRWFHEITRTPQSGSVRAGQA